MCDLGVDIGEVCRAHQETTDHFAEELAALDELANDGIVGRTGNRIRVPEHARAFVRTACAVFDAYLANEETRFSRAS